MLAKMKTPAEGWENNKRRYRSDRGVSICPAGKSGNIAAIKLKAVHRSPLSQEKKKEKKKKKGGGTITYLLQGKTYCIDLIGVY